MREQLVGVWQPAEVKPTTAGNELYKPCPEDLKHMDSTMELMMGFIQVHKGIRMCSFMKNLQQHLESILCL